MEQLQQTEKLLGYTLISLMKKTYSVRIVLRTIIDFLVLISLYTTSILAVRRREELLQNRAEQIRDEREGY